MSEEHRTPKQREIETNILGIGQERPPFDPPLAERLADTLRLALIPALDRMPEEEFLSVSNHSLQQVLGCERQWFEDLWTGWSIQKLRGTLAHRAIERLIYAPIRPNVAPPTPYEAVFSAYENMRETDKPQGVAEFLDKCSDEEIHELLRDAVDAVLKFDADWPPLKLQWHPRVESRRNYSLFD